MRRAQSYLVELINERKNSNEKGDKRDLLSNLVGSNDDLLDDGEQKLGEDELMGKRSALDPAVYSFSHRPSFRKRFHLLPCRIRGRGTLAIGGLSFDLTQLCRRRLDTRFLSS